MKKITPTQRVITGAFLLSISGCAVASNVVTDSHLDLTLKNVGLINTTDSLSAAGVNDQIAWAQALHLDWQSGWYQDVVGLNASWYGVTKLYASDDFMGRDVLRDNHGHAEGFNKLGMLYLKARWEEGQQKLQVNAGWQPLAKFGVLNITRSRGAPDSWEGISADGTTGSLRARGALVTRFSERDSPDKSRFYTLRGNKRIGYIATGDLTWSPGQTTSIRLVAGGSENYLLRQGIEISQRWPVSEGITLLSRGVFYHNRGLSEWEGARGFTHSAQHFYGQFGMQYGDAETGVGWSKTRAKLDGGLGHFYWHFGKNSRGFINSAADGEGNDYINDGEQMIYLYSQYRLTPRLLTGVYGNYGYNIRYQGVGLHEWEYGAFAAWEPESIKNLRLFLGLGPSYSWKLNHHGQPWLSADGKNFHRAKGVGGLLSIEYQLGLF
ncbi:OprD family outer membrane porin [Pantoea osteomyelitidis]|uniref:OprD family outer membrane porin n=1 Tax=Pantoea osteomyelitidis TaxID=3230026 RepID=A0ABW7PTW0_9GAMM